MMRHFTTAVVVLLSFLLIGCSKKESEQPRAPEQLQELAQAHGGVAPNAVAGIEWSVPQRWVVGPPRQMRVVTYSIPSAGDDPEPGECGVFYFGNDQGGSVDANIDRWVGQFEGGSAPVRTSKDVNGLKVTLVRIAGTYLSPGGPMMQSQGKKENFKLLGAIVQAPEGSVFFKLTGPAKTADAAESEFNSLIASLKKS